MHVTGVDVNKGDRHRETGFADARLHTALGLRDEGPGKRFYFAFQVAFHLNGISPEDIVLWTRTVEQIHHEPATPAAAVLEAFVARPLRSRQPHLTEEPPVEGNVRRSGRRVIVQDTSGPDCDTGNRSLYPIGFEARYELTAENALGDRLARVEYYVRVLKRDIGGPPEGDFEVLDTVIYPPPPPLPASSRMALTEWLYNWDFCRRFHCTAPGKLPLQMSRFTLRSWLEPYRRDSMKMSQMRQLLAVEGAGGELYHWSEDTVLEQVAELLLAGRVHLHTRHRTYSLAPDRRSSSTIYRETDYGNDGVGYPLSVRKQPSAAAGESSPRPEQQPDPPTFPRQVWMEQQAAAAVAAACSGSPFISI